MRVRLLASLLCLALFASAGPSFAGSNDKEVTELVDGTLADDSFTSTPDVTLELLAGAKQACEGNACSAKVRAKVYVAIGIVLAAGKKKQSAAKDAFILALKEDPNATLPAKFATGDTQKAFDDAKKAGGGDAGGGTATGGAGGSTASGGSSAGGGSAGSSAGGGTAGASTGGSSAGGAGSGDAKPKGSSEGGVPKPKKAYPGDVKPGRGWRTGEGYFFYQEAVASEGAHDWADCAAYAQASVAAESRVTTRYLAASCEERAGLWIEAQTDYATVAETGGAAGLRNVAGQAKAKADELAQKIPKIIVRKPAKATSLVVKLNGNDIAADKLGGELWVNPGQRTITARGKVDGVDGEFEQVVDIQEFETVTVDIKLLPPGARLKDATVLKCMAEAKTPDEFARCVGSGGNEKGSLNYGVGLEFSAYHDSDHTDVVTPAILMKVESPTGGWGVNGSLLIDVVTTASADIIANASPRWTETRYVPALGGHKKFGDVDVSLGGGASIEPDYISAGGSVGASVDLRKKTVTPALAYGFGYDLSGRSGTSFSVFSHPILRHSADASITFVVDKATFFTPSVTAVFESGDSSKPYRYIPMFSEDIANQIKNGLQGLTPEAVNQYRLNDRVLEQLPVTRQRYAIAARIAHRFASSTLRAEERLYIDSWGLKATTTDARFLVDATKEFRLWPHVRVHAQDGVDFWQIAYAAKTTSTGGKLTNLVVPYYRTGDRELGPLLGLTLGAGARIGFGKDSMWGLTATFDFVYTRFLDHLYILQRFGYFGATTLEAEFD
ncbi:MAG: DUF3570 domain-containing protein [Polyangiaceae bacterium]